ncbi:PREDICTED: pumilio homolog 12-like isoform X2 [Nelumbo nucifera]|uniref:Pumilio homolog 12-like isoform X2 n=2 Tax=Nelumbo nucifera TaxID=4432 RepID=A0A1U8AL48_NELNU|nr:PREDICTED: pumilio homolog 12-like isoform X2 [Nelumbo nucifera]DAD29162.1 TPA_asm: hypothetical protein HUJ06_030630 [Nelumbo nucifera]
MSESETNTSTSDIKNMGSHVFSPSDPTLIPSYGSPLVQSSEGLFDPFSIGQNPSLNQIFRASPQEDFQLTDYSNGEAALDANWLFYNYMGIWGDSAWYTQDALNNDIVLMAKHKQGCQFLQNILIGKDPCGTKIIFEGVLECIVDLMSHPSGNYIFQRLVEVCSIDQLQEIVLRITRERGALIHAAVDHFGTRSVQKLVKMTKKLPLITYVISALAPGILALMLNQTGSHVIRHCLVHLDSQQNRVIFEVAVKYCLRLATHEQGCVSLNNCIDCIKDPHRKQLINMISVNAVQLSQDPFGNYVVQRVLALQNPEFTKIICYQLQGYYVLLSMQKCGSHVVEKCLKSPWISNIVNEFLANDKLVQLARDPFGNYVIQTALKLCTMACISFW